MHGHFRHTPTIVIVDRNLVRSFIESDLFDNSMPFDITTPIYLTSLLWKLGLGIGLDLELRKITKERAPIFSEFHGGNILLNERTQTINNKTKLHILGVPMNKLGNWLIGG